MSKLFRFVNYLSYSIVFITGILLMLYGIIYLEILGRTETKIKEKVIVRFSSETEYKVDKPFWWLVKGSNEVLIKNESDETHRGKLVLKVQTNPCQIPVTVNLKNDKDSKSSLNFVTLNQKKRIVISFQLSPRSEKRYSLLLNMQKSCVLSNGDSRKLALKVVDFKFE